MATCDDNCSGYSSNDDCTDYDYDDVNYYLADDIPLHPLLEDDIRRLQAIYGEHSCTYRVLEGITDMTLNIHIPTTRLERDTAAAWNLNHGEPLTVSISIDRNLYLDASNFQKIEISQASQQQCGGAIQQLQNIANLFCQSTLRYVTNNSASEAVSKEKYISHEDILYLVEMGFPQSIARMALKAANGSKEDAVGFLLDHQSGNISDDVMEKIASETPNPSSQEKEMPSLENGFLVQLFQYLSQRLMTLSSYCPICDNPHEFTNMAMLKPSVCHNELCIFSFTTLGLMSNVADSITSFPEVTDLLIRLTTSAVLSERHEIILTPYPAFADPKRPHELAMHEKCRDIDLLRTIVDHLPPPEELFQYSGKETEKQLEKHHPLCFPLIRWIIRSNRSYIVALPKHKQIKIMGTGHQFLMKSMPPVEEKKFVEKRRKHGSLYAFHGSPIENWHSIIREGLIVASGTKKQLNGTAYGKGIYLSPDLSTSLGYSRLRYFTGSQVHMDSFVHSIPKSSRIFSGNSKFLLGSLCCIALCEVINDGLLKKNEIIWVCTESSNVCTRFFFVYDVNNPSCNLPRHTVNTGNEDILAQIQNAIQDTLLM